MKKESPYKQTLTVTCRYPADAEMYPVSFEWHDGNTYEIKKILQSFTGTIYRHGSFGPVYKCLVGNSIIWLGMDNLARRWYLEYDHERVPG